MKLRRSLCALCAAALLLSLLPAALAGGTAPFPDAGDIQHSEAVSAIVKLGLMSAKDDGAFDPQGTVTRAEAARMMALILTGGKDISPTLPAQPSFPDIQGHWAEPYIESCAGRGLTFPREEGGFEPNGDVTLFELLQMAEVALGRLPREFTQSSYWMAAALTFALHRGLLTGLDDFQGKALTDHPVTREEAAQVLYNALNATPETLEDSSTGFFEDVKRPDGTPNTLLYENFGYLTWEDVRSPDAGKDPAPRSADAAQLTDAAQIGHWEAVAALCRLGVVSGRDDGAFHPADTVTRAEAAKLIALLMLGGRDMDTGIKVDPSFSDIRGHWAESYIEYCADLAILSGRGDGRFDPEGQVTGVELCKIALAALGYDPAAYQLTGPRWAEKTDELARYTDPSLYRDLSGVAMTSPISRDDAAQILYNALQATTIMVAPGGVGEDGKISWQFKPSDRTLLKERFALDAVGALPAQPKR